MKMFFLCHKKRNMYVITLLIILINTFLMFKIYNNNSKEKIEQYAYNIVNKYVYDLVSSYFNNELIMRNDWQEILKITKNSEGEILLVDFDLKQANALNKAITNNLNLNINKVSNENSLIPNDNIVSSNSGLLINIPFFAFSKWPLLNNLGPRIFAKAELIGSVKTNLKTSVKNYGLNNSLAEIYVATEVKVSIITPSSTTEYLLNYDILLDSKLIQGRVPYFYDGNLVSEKTVFSFC